MVAKAGLRFGKALANEFLTQFTEGTVDQTTKQSSDDTFSPAVKDPLKFYLDIQGELGLCFSYLRDEVETAMKLADSGTAMRATPSQIAARFRTNPLLLHEPKTKDMPDEKAVAREAELGMWIAWSFVRDADWWTKRARDVDTPEDRAGHRGTWTGKSYDELMKLQPVVARLVALGVESLGTVKSLPSLYGEYDGRQVLVLDMNKLRTAGAYLAVLPEGAVFLGRVGEVVKDPKKLLPELADTEPMFRRVER